MDSGEPEGNNKGHVEVEGSSWIPVTPMKPILPRPPLIYARMDRNQSRPHWLGSERLSAETSSGANGSYDWEAAQSGQLQVATHSIDALVGIPFLQLMALADAASIVGGNASDQIELESSSMKGRLGGSCITEATECKSQLI